MHSTVSSHPLISSKMAMKFVAVLALVAVCSSSPVLINGVVYRDGRAYSIGQAYNYNGGASVASANVQGDNAQAYGSTAGNTLARDGLVYPEQVIAQAQTFGGEGKAVAQAQNGGYYTVPEPATVITYEQNFAVPAEVSYEYPGAVYAQSSAINNGISESAITSATSNGGGVAESSAKTGTGSFGVTSSNAKTYGGYGQADSKANSGFNSASTSARTQGQGSASSTAQTNGGAGVVYPVVPVGHVIVPSQELMPAVIDARRTPVFHTAYVPVAPAGVASANANVVGSGNAASSAKVSNGRTISWRFGTLYDQPAAGSANAQARTQGTGNAKAQATSNGFGSANAGADSSSAGYGSAKSNANVNGAGSANAIADVNAPGYGLAKSIANTQHGSATSTANSGAFGQAKSTANVQGGYYSGSRTFADAQTRGYGSASSSARAQPVSTIFRVANSGFAQANAQTA